MKNGSKKNETDSKLDCYHNRVKPVLTLQHVSVGSSNNVCVDQSVIIELKILFI